MAIVGREQERRQERALDRTAGENKGSGANSVQDQPNPLEQDLEGYEQLARSSPDPQVRKAWAELASLIKDVESLKPSLSEAAEELGIDALCAKLPSEEIAFLIALPEKGAESNVRRMLRKNLLKPSLLRPERRWTGEMFLDFMCSVFQYALRSEYLSRRQNKENKYGRAVREALVEEERRGELIAKLGKDVTPGLIFPNEVGWNRWWKSEEAPEEAILKIWERASEFAKVTPVAADPKALQAFMEGSLNDIPQQARDHVRTLIETEIRHRDVVIDVQGRKEERISTSQQRERMQVLVEIKCSRPADQDQKILVEQLLSLPGLKSRDKEIARLLHEGRTQKQIATALGMSQGEVSKRLTDIRGLMKAALSSTQSER
jgi:DNA-directed RNA polymerase specialized sigma24 family protein